ncbi:hypothetical protein ACPOLB_12760 [Rubrivivax sp. RP6-9]|uniref:hypothetical protein n=1 Tax=Rubrivivax sp. RP6-9 TaxID=3415750 RepID=UPI003CC56469
MNTLTMVTPAALRRGWLGALFAGERRLALFGLVMVLAMLPALVALGLDERMLRGVNVWVKPLKFMASLALFAWTTAWCVGLLPAARRRSRAVAVVAWTIVVAGSFEIVYITLQAALGEASHYNVGDPLHGGLYTLMGAAALLMTATQPLLAWQIHRHGRPEVPLLLRRAVVAGLVATFVLGAGAGGLLGGLQPPPGAGLPVVGWHLLGDLRPAHFLGMHAQQLLPLAGWVFLQRGGGPALLVFSAAYGALWVVAMGCGLALGPPG